MHLLRTKNQTFHIKSNIKSVFSSFFKHKKLIKGVVVVDFTLAKLFPFFSASVQVQVQARKSGSESSKDDGF